MNKHIIEGTVCGKKMGSRHNISSLMPDMTRMILSAALMFNLLSFCMHIMMDGILITRNS